MVTYGYRPNGALNSASGNASYLAQATYTAWGAIDTMELGTHGSATAVQVDYSYYAWNGGSGEGWSRLYRITAGVTGSLTSLQDLRYTDYDPVGNVKQIQDYKAGGTQTQGFTYDDLSRILTASASGGSGGTYSENYAYSGADGKLGNLTSKGSTNYTYGNQPTPCLVLASSKPHAVWKTISGGATNYYCYDEDGNQVQRTVGGTTYTLNYDQENRLSSVSGGATASFTYGPSGERVKGVVGTTTTYYIGNYYEKVGTTVRKYYYAGGARVAMREGEALYYLFSDHLGSTSITANSSGTKVAEVRYRAFGEDRYTSGTRPTSYRYTGQRSEMTSIGLYYYNARWYDPSLGRFAQADTVIPGIANPQAPLC